MAVSDLFAWPRGSSRFKWDTESRVDQAHADEAARVKQERAVYAHVSAREGYRCRVCARGCDPAALSILAKGHHHHVVYRSAGGGTTVDNVVLLCARCHDAVHRHRIAIKGHAEDAPWLTLWQHDPARGWYVWRQEVGMRIYERD